MRPFPAHNAHQGSLTSFAASFILEANRVHNQSEIEMTDTTRRTLNQAAHAMQTEARRARRFAERSRKAGKISVAVYNDGRANALMMACADLLDRR